jgi:GMP synthase (glutamine-hydrolysing)
MSYAKGRRHQRGGMRTIWVLQHIHCETLGILASALESSGFAAHYIRTFKGEVVPTELGDTAGLIVMGGPMGVYEHSRYPFLKDEMRLIENALRSQRPILGICLGSQLLAATLGAEVTKAEHKEIGWHSVRLSAAARIDPLWAEIDTPFTAYHWHGDIFALPRGAERLAASDLTRCQAFRYDRSAYGFLFHLEVTEAIINEMVRTFAGELTEARIDGQDIISAASDHLGQLHRIGRAVFRRWSEVVLAV